MELMKVILHSDLIERFEKVYPPKKIAESSAEMKQWYAHYLTAIQDLKIVDLRFNKHNLELSFSYDGYGVIEGEWGKVKYIFPVPEEFIKEIIYDPRIGLGYCTQCHTEYPIKTGCTDTGCIYGKCHPKNFIPYLDKEGKKVFKGGYHYKQVSEWKPDEFIPYPPERMEKNRQGLRDQITEKNLEPTPYEEAWTAFWKNQIQFEKFEKIISQLLAKNEITQAQYENGLHKAKKYKKLLVISKE